jgi:transcription antitermination factor NusG
MRPPAEPTTVLSEARWVCVRTGHDLQLTADIEIRRAGFQLFSPSVWKRATATRRRFDGMIRPARPDRIEPLFKRYLFVRLHLSAHNWQIIRHLPGVDGFMGLLPGTPSPVPDAAIDGIRALCSPNDCIYPASVALRSRLPALVSSVPLVAGSRTRLLDGPMADLTGICQWSDAKRVRLLMDILGRTVLVTVPRDRTEPADPT